MKKVVILGGGFAGVNLARDLGRNPQYSITLIDKNNYNFFPPLIYQVAAGFMSPSDISYPFRKLFNRHPRARYRKGTVTRVDTGAKRVFLEQGDSVAYDMLIIALGAQPNYFGNREVEQNAYTMKTLGDALAIRNNILAQLEAACAQPREARAPYLHREVSQRYTASALQKLGVDIIYNDPVTAYDGQTITLKSGTTIAAKSLIWTAGVTAVKLAGIPESSYGRGNRLRVDRQLRVIGLEDVYAIGDCAIVEGDSAYPNGHPQLGQVAKAQGKYLGKALGRSDKAFVYKHRGDMAMIGRLSAVADMPGGRSLQGMIAWFIWVVVHILALVTFKNRIAATYNWSIAFLTKNQAMRMNIQPSPPRGRRE